MEKGRACEHPFKYRNLPTTTHLVKKIRFSCQNVKCQNVQNCDVGGFHVLDMFVRLCARDAE